MSCGPAIYVAVVASSLVGFIVVAAICAVVLAHRERMRALRRDPFLDPDFVRGNADPLTDLVARYRAFQK